MSEVKNFKKGDVIFLEGDSGDSLYQIQEGKVAIIVNYGKEAEQKLTELGAGQFFGEMAALEGNRRSATVIALEDTAVTEIAHKEMAEYFTDQPEKIIGVLKNITGRIRDLTDDFNEANAALNAMKEDSSKKPSQGLFDKINKILKGVPSETVQEMQESAHGEGLENKVYDFPAGTIIFNEGDPGTCMYDIQFGRVGIYTGYGTENQKELTVLYPNTFFGEMGMIDNEPRSATAVVLDDHTTIEIIYPEDLAKLMKKNPAKLDMIAMHLSNRLRRLTNDYIKVCEEIDELA